MKGKTAHMFANPNPSLHLNAKKHLKPRHPYPYPESSPKTVLIKKAVCQRNAQPGQMQDTFPLQATVTLC